MTADRSVQERDELVEQRRGRGAIVRHGRPIASTGARSVATSFTPRRQVSPAMLGLNGSLTQRIVGWQASASISEVLPVRAKQNNKNLVRSTVPPNARLASDIPVTLERALRLRSMRLIRPSDHRPTRWKNGGGVTHEIVVEPPGESHFVFRISIADVTTDGPFSRFEGYDRHILVLEGAGMTLDAGEHGRIELGPMAPVTFSGDWDVTGILVAGPVRDFNLIVDRARAGSWLRVRDVTDTTVFGFRGTAIVHVLAGTLDEATAGDTIVASDEELTVHGHAKLAVANVVSR